MLWTGLLIINLYSFIIMGLDKYFAKQNKDRISEFHLMLTATIGGSFGIYIGMKFFRHKTKHIKFTIGVPLLLLLNIGTIYVLT
ncbi:DUF1294 domain-containing protein [Natranaerobius trueperi]|uniref:DUF1294 domain-containing protein n=1 Tax=Natranaerobius trueperi TaxID=759412 RepID=UPI001F0AFD41|nr:DUF1294 domain-containing protein [Natranaerobius trueperi]